jgi:hypothetical protein
MNRLVKKLMILPFVLPAVVVNVDGCWRPVTAALGWIGIDVSTNDDGNVHIGLWGSGDHEDDDD